MLPPPQRRGEDPCDGIVAVPMTQGLVAPDTLQGVSTTDPIDTSPDQHEVRDTRDAGEEHDVRELADIPAAEVISRAAVLLMSAAAEQLGLASPDPHNPEHRDLDQARTLIVALAGLVNAAAPDMGPHAAAFRDGLAGLQGAFREYSVHPDEPGKGPGE